MGRVKWFERKFDFDYTENVFPEILERLQDTPSRLTGLIQSIPDFLLQVRL